MDAKVFRGKEAPSAAYPQRVQTEDTVYVHVYIRTVHTERGREAEERKGSRTKQM